jgi:hypothetical protein
LPVRSISIIGYRRGQTVAGKEFVQANTDKGALLMVGKACLEPGESRKHIFIEADKKD